MQDHLAAFADNAVHHIGLHQRSPVHRRAYGSGQLDGGHGDALAKADAGQGIVVNILLVGHDAAALPGDAAARGAPKPEAVDVIVKGLHPHGQGHLHEGRIAGILHRLDQGLAAMASVLPAFDPLLVYHVRAIAMVGGGFIHRAAVQGGRQGDDLKGRAGFVAIRHHPVAAQGIE